MSCLFSFYEINDIEEKICTEIFRYLLFGIFQLPLIDMIFMNCKIFDVRHHLWCFMILFSFFFVDLTVVFLLSSSWRFGALECCFQISFRKEIFLISEYSYSTKCCFTHTIQFFVQTFTNYWMITSKGNNFQWTNS